MKRDPGLDLLRATAIVWVMLFHAMTEGLGTPLQPVGRIGWMAVDLFFVLSGYLIGSQLFKTLGEPSAHPLQRFYIRRLLRILPTYWVILACYTLAPPLREASGLQAPWQFVTFTENFLIDYHHNQAFSHAWSLCVEEHFYLLFPLLAWLLLRRPSWRVTVAVCSAVFFAGFAFRLAAWHSSLDDGRLLRSQPWRFIEAIYYPTTTRADGLLAGVVLAALRSYRPKIWSAALARPYPLMASGAGALAVAIWIAQPRTTFGAAIFGFPLLAGAMALLVAAFASPASFFGRVKIPGARFLATITFSLYLSHKMTWHVIRRSAPSLVPPGTVEVFAVYAAAALAVGTLLHLCVERPFLSRRETIEKWLLPAPRLPAVAMLPGNRLGRETV